MNNTHAATSSASRMQHGDSDSDSSTPPKKSKIPKCHLSTFVLVFVCSVRVNFYNYCLELFCLFFWVFVYDLFFCTSLLFGHCL